MKQHILNGLIILFLATSTESVLAARLEVLMIGNSYTLQTNQTVAEFFEADPGIEITLDVVANGGWKLDQHWRDGTAAARIAQNDWDYVVLQEYSTRGPLAAESGPEQDAFFNAVRSFNTIINQHGAKTVLFQTWPRNHGHSVLDQFGGTPESMQAATRVAYGLIAEEIGALVVPVGDNWLESMNSYPEIRLHSQDNHHPNTAGALLTAAVFYNWLLEESPQLITYTGGVAETSATNLKIIATDIVNQPSPAPSPTDEICRKADLHPDGVVNLQDYLILAADFLTTEPRADINQDGNVNLNDYLILAQYFLQPCS